tara:strand:+ start:269 stop:784 length:516 start_codon:yes stop_codon:yes gene_type:complete
MADSTITNLSTFVNDINRLFSENLDYSLKGLPTTLWLLPLCNFLMSPKNKNAVLLYGAICITIIGSLTSSIQDQNFLKNIPSFHGMALGYFAGYAIFKSVSDAQTAYILSSIVFCLILTIFLTAKLYGIKNVSHNILNVGGGCILGIFIGCIFSYLEQKSSKNCSDNSDKN